jgi:hypothetical protein
VNNTQNFPSQFTQTPYICDAPRGIRTHIPLSVLKKVLGLPCIGLTFIHSMAGAKRIKQKSSTLAFYCVRMTVAVEIEGHKRGIQTIEDRFMLIKASSSEDAYRKMEKQKKKYTEPYLNSDGELVRWRIESLDDCYSTYALTADDFNNPEGVEVFSVLKGRKMTEQRYWDGK